MEVPFSISARTAKLIGMENFANAEGAIVELVKNAYDADADMCVVVCHKVGLYYKDSVFLAYFSYIGPLFQTYWLILWLQTDI